MRQNNMNFNIYVNQFSGFKYVTLMEFHFKPFQDSEKKGVEPTTGPHNLRSQLRKELEVEENQRSAWE